MVADPIGCKTSRSRYFFGYHPPDKFSRIPGLAFTRSGTVVEDDAAILTVLASKDKASPFGIAPAFLAPSGLPDDEVLTVQSALDHPASWLKLKELK